MQRQREVTALNSPFLCWCWHNDPLVQSSAQFLLCLYLPQRNIQSKPVLSQLSLPHKRLLDSHIEEVSSAQLWDTKISLGTLFLFLLCRRI
jgi:hypothetical protein